MEPIKHAERHCDGVATLEDKDLWICPKCCWSVGCYPGTEKPLGTLAGPELRVLRMQVHAVFDPLWRKYKVHVSRGKAYGWLAKAMAVDSEICHIAMFNTRLCKMAVGVIVLSYPQTLEDLKFHNFNKGIL